MRTEKFVVILNVPDDINNREATDYIRNAIHSWSDRFKRPSPFDDLGSTKWRMGKYVTVKRVTYNVVF